MKKLILLPLLVLSFTLFAQDYRWQQRVEYKMNVAMDVKTHKVTGDQELVYHNNSNDTLRKVYYHLYFNAFQPGSMMDVRSRNLPDPDRRVMDRISKLNKDEIGYQNVQSLKQDGQDTKYQVDGTVLTVYLAKPIMPHTKTVFNMKFEAQVPIQIRRSGRDNKEGIAYSMTQWYPKLAEYDFQGWHAYEYVAREFHGVWGDYDVTINIDPKFTIGGSGVLQNPNEIGHGYEDEGVKIKNQKGNLNWHFVAKNVHDFAWAADPEYAHTRAQVPNGPELHFFYQPGEKTTETWTKLKEYAVKHFQFMNETFGKYPYPVYSIIQGGDGGMEYPMCTLIVGEGSFAGLVGVMAHEASHAWFQGVLGTNESLYPWMDEGYTDFSSNESLARMFNVENPHQDSYNSYFKLVERGLQEPLSQHADHYSTNTAYGTAAYSMGAMFLNQMKYLIGNDTFYQGMRRYFNTWKFRHPEPNDFLRVMEKESGLQLHWYYRYWILTTKHIDYGITGIVDNQGKTEVTLKRVGEFPMPIDLLVTYKDGSKEMFYIPMNETLGSKGEEDKSVKWTELERWNWVNPNYSFIVNKSSSEIESMEIDPSQRMADIDRGNNTLKIGK
ncbi:MAG: M1 family metallopeptidase [Cyclobacteriaceae bacterium]|nr:M1 family metallopeptidase [Cyclobacteriaceae bacterium]